MGTRVPSSAAAASAAATPRVDVEKGPQAAAAPGYMVVSSQVCVREEGETKVQAKFPVFIQDLTGKRHCVMVEGGWDVHDLTRWAAVNCGVLAGAFYWTFQSRKWGDHGELMNDVGRDARACYVWKAFVAGRTKGAKFGLPVEGDKLRDDEMLACSQDLLPVWSQ